MERIEIEQGSADWLSLRKTKITATDAAVIMGSPWKSRVELFFEKISDEPPPPPNDAMQRGTMLEPVARELFMAQTGLEVEPAVVVRDWAMASLDGISKCDRYVVEIKCPGVTAHDLAMSGQVPDYYYAQLQHQLYVCNLDWMYYYSFDGLDGVYVVVKRDEKYIDDMVENELKFYACLKTGIAPDEEFII